MKEKIAGMLWCQNNKNRKTNVVTFQSTADVVPSEFHAYHKIQKQRN